MKCPKCNTDIQSHWVACPACADTIPQKRVCPKCGNELEAEWKVCPFCAQGAEVAGGPQTAEVAVGTESVGAEARVELHDAVVKQVTQEAAGGVQASVKATDAVVGGIDQTAAGSVERAAEAVRELAGINVTDGVVKSINQVVNVHLGAAQAVDAVMGEDEASRLRARMVFVACGRQIKAYDPAAPPRVSEPASVYSLPDEMGSARSVRLARVESRLMILAGARCGVVAFDSRTGDAQVYPFGDATQYGANAATVHGDFVYATHSDFGLLRWPVGGGEPISLLPEVFEAANAVRAVQVDLEGNLLACTDSAVYIIDPDRPSDRPVEYAASGHAELVGGVECDGYIYAATIDGQLLRWHMDVPTAPETIAENPGCKSYCVSLVQRRDGPHLVVGCKADHICLVRLTPPPATVHYHAPDGASIRWARAAPDLLAASDNECSKLFFWRASDTHGPDRTIAVAKSPRERIMDICILSH